MSHATRRNILKTGIFFACCGVPHTRAALAWSMSADPLPVKQVADGVFAFAGAPAMMTRQNEGEICNVGFIIGDDSVAVIDSGGSVVEGKALIGAIRAKTDRPVRYLINTHMHPDHLFGNAAFKSSGATVVGHHNLPRALESRGTYYLQSYREAMGDDLMADIRIVPPTKLITDEEDLDIGNRKLTLRAWKAAHTDNDLSVFDHKTGVLFTGDLCFIDHLPTIDGSLLGWIAQLDILNGIKAKFAVPGHGAVPSPWPQALEAERRYFDVLASDIRRAIADGVPMTNAVKSAAQRERANWKLFDEYNQRNAIAAFAELEWE
ncbi:quinoprotein relay system zinc metallohydrolase 2 [Phyllobacterium myrsinacearum]|uniref:Quinoprotein relay system zinc metallohydrolase 2 n=1 Tax=Phyllobacterium myrsinacearum TaxID=28101 RepID=A0A839ELN6_9HYPH|nr:quinoprotein relay system zinc metallohydrolase 2 [Phyllobacterium myrsinacearum]MBA8881433.1 quinoprotein relay system zinc metallohydrolase 2 [Phyllobacterium myrsinacearum]